MDFFLNAPMSKPTTLPVFEAKKEIFAFCCPICRHQVSNDSDMEPVCTGPTWRDDHKPQIMTRVR